jgi:serine-type D-Ala-D-Ala carboxypeptidase/endopeptidase (penicillin-binding protein 4)
MNKILIIILFILSINHLTAQSISIEEAVNVFQSKHFVSDSSWGYCVATEKNELLNHNGSAMLKPASIQKLITTGVALTEIDSSFRYETKLGYDGKIINDTLFGNIFIMGSGDPSFGSGLFDSTDFHVVFKSFGDALKKLRVNVITGSVIAEAVDFDTTLFPAGVWNKDDYGNYYGAGSCGLNFHENYYTVYFNPGKKIGDSTSVVRIDPEIPGMKLINKVKTAKAKSGDNVIIYGKPYQNTRTLTGTVPIDSQKFPVKGSMPDPAAACTLLFQKYLTENGISFFEKSDQQINSSTTQHTIVTHYSPSLSQLIKITNQQSNNVFAESILKTIAVWKKENGIKIILNHLNKSTSQQINLVDGSGLSDQNRMSSKVMVDFLLDMKKQNQFPAFFNSLPVACRSGSLKSFGCGSVLENRLHAKTGSMKGIRCYAGYLINSKNEWVAFCLMVNDYKCTNQQILQETEKLLSIMGYLK